MSQHGAIDFRIMLKIFETGPLILWRLSMGSAAALDTQRGGLLKLHTYIIQNVPRHGPYQYPQGSLPLSL